MNKEKYYTPSIEEFHVNFECEILNGYGEWFKIIFDKSHLYNDLKFTDKFDNLENAFRVKFLDKEDIESLGWLFDEAEKDCLAFVKNQWDLWYYLETRILIIESEETGVLFTGTIKNKSELKKLFTQLGIN